MLNMTITAGYAAKIKTHISDLHFWNQEWFITDWKARPCSVSIVGTISRRKSFAKDTLPITTTEDMRPCSRGLTWKAQAPGIQEEAICSEEQQQAKQTANEASGLSKKVIYTFIFLVSFCFLKEASTKDPKGRNSWLKLGLKAFFFTATWCSFVEPWWGNSGAGGLWPDKFVLGQLVFDLKTKSAHFING